MPPKQKSKNAFYFFMLDFKKREEKIGRKFPHGIADVAKNVKCQQEWTSMSKQQKGPYEKMAKEDKYKLRGYDKQTGTGESIDLLELEEVKQKEFYENMKSFITTTLSEAHKFGRLDKEIFYIIHVNYFIERVKGLNDVDYDPAEISVVRFSLRNGIEKTFHKIMYYKVPLGFRLQFAEHCEATHQIPDEYPLGEKNFENVYKELIEFISKDGNSPLPPLYTSQASLDSARSFIAKIAAAGGQEPEFISIYQLEWLFSKLHTTITDKSVFNHAVADLELSKDKFAYYLNMECEYHAFLDGSSIHCSLSKTKRWIYVMCDFLCEDMGIECIPSKHLPPSQDNDICIKMSKIKLVESPVTCQTVSLDNVSKNHRIKVSSRTTEEDRKRREAATDIVIINYGETSERNSVETLEESSSVSTNSSSPSSVSSPSSSGWSKGGVWGHNKKSASNTPLNIHDDQSFPSIGGSWERNSSNNLQGDYNTGFPELGRGKVFLSKQRGRGKARGRGKFSPA